MKKIIILSLLLVGLISCQPIIKTIYGIKKPKIENEQTLTKYMVKKNINQDNVYTVRFDNYESTLKSINNTIPEVLIFKKKDNSFHTVTSGHVTLQSLILLNNSMTQQNIKLQIKQPLGIL